ncbi:MAG: hypothetical protein R2845_05575 [Thermomicrobiales bacterium]
MAGIGLPIMGAIANSIPTSRMTMAALDPMATASAPAEAPGDFEQLDPKHQRSQWVRPSSSGGMTACETAAPLTSRTVLNASWTKRDAPMTTGAARSEQEQCRGQHQTTGQTEQPLRSNDGRPDPEHAHHSTREQRPAQRASAAHRQQQADPGASMPNRSTKRSSRTVWNAMPNIEVSPAEATSANRMGV